MLNKVQLIGRLGKNPEVQYIAADTQVARFSLATSEYYKTKEGEQKELLEWHNIVAWRNLAKYAESHLVRGLLVYIEGHLQTRHWTDKNQIERYTTEIIADNILIL